METVWKYAIPLDDETILQVPQYATPLKAGVQNGIIYIWFRVETAMAKEDVRVIIRATGDSLPVYDRYSPRVNKYVDTVFIGSLVFHIFVKGYANE